MKHLYALRWKSGLFRRLARWLAHRTPTCAEMARLSSAALERPLTLRERVLRAAHFLACDWCHRYARQLRFLRIAGRRAPNATPAEPPFRMPGEVRERLGRKLARPSSPPPTST